MFQLIFLLALAVGSHCQKVRIGTIEFFGTSGMDVQKVRTALPVREGDEIAEDQVASIRSQINQITAKTVGHLPTDVDLTCCNEKQELMIYIGLGGNNTVNMPLRVAPKYSACLPRQALNLYHQVMDAVEQAVKSGNASEDDSHGYALSDDRGLRAKQLAMREYALTHERIVERALQVCERAEHRRAAAQILGYVRKSEAQIRDLVLASRDSDALVRNNAVRALWCLASSNRKTASEIPADGFIEMLNSGVWGDRNKAGVLLMVLTAPRSPRLLRRLQKEALQSLVEMSRWRAASHADPYRAILGRIAGFDEARIEQLIQSGRVEEIIGAASHR